MQKIRQILLLFLLFHFCSIKAQLPSQELVRQEGIRVIRIMEIPLDPSYPEGWESSIWVSEEQKNQPDTPRCTYTFHFDSLGRIIEQIQLYARYTYRYDGQGRLIEQVQYSMQVEKGIYQRLRIAYDSSGSYTLKREMGSGGVFSQKWVTADGKAYRDSSFNLYKERASFYYCDTLTGNAVVRRWEEGKLNFQRTYTWEYDDSGRRIGLTYEMQQHAPGKGRAPNEKRYYTLEEDGCPAIETGVGKKTLEDLCAHNFPAQVVAPFPDVHNSMNMDTLPQQSEIVENALFSGLVLRSYNKYEYERRNDGMKD